MSNIPSMLAAYDKKRKRIFVLAIPNVSAVKIDDIWHYAIPLSDEEIDQYDLITDLRIVKQLVDEAKAELQIP
jgi:hypothetical protein